MLRLYKFIESCLDDTFENVTYESIDEDNPNNVGIFLYPAENDEVGMDGVHWENIKAQIQVTVDSREDDMQKVSDYLRGFVSNIESKLDSGDANLLIIDCSRLRQMPTKFHTNNQMISKWESEVRIQYKLIDKE